MEYTCESCGTTFISEWSDDDARKESIQTFGEHTLEAMAVVCDGCFDKIKSTLN